MKGKDRKIPGIKKRLQGTWWEGVGGKHPHLKDMGEGRGVVWFFHFYENHLY